MSDEEGSGNGTEPRVNIEFFCKRLGVDTLKHCRGWQLANWRHTKTGLLNVKFKVCALPPCQYWIDDEVYYQTASGRVLKPWERHHKPVF